MNQMSTTNISDAEDDNTHKSETDSSDATWSQFCEYWAEDVIDHHNSQHATALWETIQKQIARTSASQFPSIAPQIYKLLDAIANIKGINSSPIRTIVDEYRSKAAKFCKIESTLSSRMTPKEKGEELHKLTEQLGNFSLVRIKAAEEKCSSVRYELEKINQELRNLHAKRAKLESSLSNHEKFLAERVAERSRIEEKVTVVKKTPVISDSDALKLQRMRSLLDDARNKIAENTWHPTKLVPPTHL